MANDEAWWAKTRNLMIAILVLWAVFGFLIHAFVARLNTFTLLDFPLGFYMAAQGSLIISVALIFWFAHHQDAIDRKHDVADSD